MFEIEPSRFLKQSARLLYWWRLSRMMVAEKPDPRVFMTAESFLADTAKEAYENLLKQGKPVWGSLVQANSMIFEWGQHNLPASYIYSPEDYFGDNPNHLLEISNRIFALKGTQTGDAALDALANRITDERKDSFSYPVPYQVTDGHEVYLTSVMLFRESLPEGRLTSRLLPLLVDPPNNGLALPLPLMFWSKKMIGYLGPGIRGQIKEEIWKTIWQTEVSPPEFQPALGGDREIRDDEIDWLIETPPVKISATAHHVLRDHLLSAGHLAIGAILVFKEEDEIGLSLMKRGDNEPCAKFMLEDVMYCFPSGQFNEREGVKIDYQNGPFQRGMIFEEIFAEAPTFH